MSEALIEQARGLVAIEEARGLIDDLVARLRKLQDALRESAVAHHGLSDEPEHQRHVFAECPDYHCVRARAVLEAER